jgi:4-amino-4-deoxy-L-arabinose transferase-like glycosyltransferase/membrane-associated phospholipid phosphatase
MSFLQHLDLWLFHLINYDLAGPAWDPIMIWLSGNAAFFPLLLVLAFVIIKKGGSRGAAFVMVAVLAALVAGDWVAAPLKEFWQRPRPAMVLPDVRVVGGNGYGLTAMPSGHATTWGALAIVVCFFYRRAGWLGFPLAFLVGYSRIYLGVHHPSDVVAGWILGALTGLVVAGLSAWLWTTAGRRAFPVWWHNTPNLLRATGTSHVSLSERDKELTWRHATWLVLGLLFVARLFYIAGDTIELSEDEAYQWMWSRRLDWAYYSKPPLIAWIQWLGTHLWGHTAFGVRFFSPVFALVMGLVLWNFLRRHTNERTAFWATLVFAATPFFAVGSTLLTVDSPTVLFYTLSVLAMWQALETDRTLWWLLAGLAMAMGFLSKFFSPFLWAGFFLYAAFTPSARKQFRRPGVWLALAMNLLALAPVLWWNQQHDWVTLVHLSERGGLQEPGGFRFQYVGTFLGSVAALLNPVFFVAVIGAVVGFFRDRSLPLLQRFLLCSALPVIVFYLALACHAKAQPNWIAPAAPALFLFAILYWHERHTAGKKWGARWLTAGLVVGLPVVTVLHETQWLHKGLGVTLTEKNDPLTRVRGASELASLVEEHRQHLAVEGQPVFVIADHYGRASLLNFYLPEARQLLPEDQLVYVLATEKPQNQYWFWPSYDSRAGENAIYVVKSSRHHNPPLLLTQQFRSVQSLGLFKIRHRGELCSEVQLFACYSKKPSFPQLTGQP